MKTAAVRENMASNRKNAVRRNSVFLAPSKPEAPVQFKSTARERNQLSNFWSSVDSAMYSIAHHGGKGALERLRNRRKSSDIFNLRKSEPTNALSEKALLRNREVSYWMITTIAILCFFIIVSSLFVAVFFLISSSFLFVIVSGDQRSQSDQPHATEQGSLGYFYRRSHHVFCGVYSFSYWI